MNVKQKPNACSVAVASNQIINAEDYIGFALYSDHEATESDDNKVLDDDNDCCKLKKQLDEAEEIIFNLEFQIDDLKRQQKIGIANAVDMAVSNAKQAKRVKKLKSTVQKTQIYRRRLKRLKSTVRHYELKSTMAFEEIKKLKSTVSEYKRKLVSAKASFEQKEKKASASLNELQSKLQLQKLEAEKKMEEYKRKLVSAKASFEQKEKKASASLNELQSQLQKLEAEKKMEEEKSYRWDWEADINIHEYERYPSAVCAQINQLQVGESMKHYYDKWSSTITKITPDECVQVNDQTKKSREVKRFQVSSPIQIKEGKYYTAAKDLDDTDIIKLFYQTVSKNVRIQEIKNVEHQYQKHNYELCLFEKCEEMKKTRDQVERYLFHGTDHYTLQFVIKNGFDRSYNKNGAYGKGTYFAKDASYSVNNRYCKRHSDGFHYLLLCKVIVGDSTTGNSSTTKVPLKANQVEYDSLVNRANSPSIFVVWRDYRAIHHQICMIKASAYAV